MVRRPPLTSVRDRLSASLDSCEDHPMAVVAAGKARWVVSGVRGLLFCLVVVLMLPVGNVSAQVSPPIVLPIPGDILPPSLRSVPALAAVVAGGYAVFDIITGGDPLGWAAFGAGAAAGLVVANIATGGAVMAPILGVVAAEAWGGGLYATRAAVANPGWIRDMTLIGSAWIGGKVGTRLYGGR
jgi:hypothetical protein